MRIIRDLKNFKGPIKKSVVAIGEFDALHLGHMALIKRVKELSFGGYRSILVTFDPYPREVLLKRPVTERLLTKEEKLELIGVSGIDTIAFIRFDKDFSKIDACQFVKDCLVKKLGMKTMVAGEDFSLGRNRSGSVSVLRHMGKKLDFRFVPVRTVIKNGREVKSSSIRELVRSGRTFEAFGLLGRFYSLQGKVVRGKRRNIGFKTANLSTPEKLLPKDGIYASYSYFRGRKYQSITYIGKRPTFSGNRVSIETNIFNFSKNLYGKKLKVELVKMLRCDKKFRDVKSLQSQIKNDIKRAAAIL